jgi:hypothetical protein
MSRIVDKIKGITNQVINQEIYASSVQWFFLKLN